MMPLGLQHATKPCGLCEVIGATKTLIPVIRFGAAFVLLAFFVFHILPLIAAVS